MLISLARLGIWLLLAISLVVIGWDEPLRYKFISPAQIVALENEMRASARENARVAPVAPPKTPLNTIPAPQPSHDKMHARPQFGDR